MKKNPEKRLTPKERKMKMGKGFVYHQSSQPFYRVKILMKNLEREPELYVNKIEKKVYQIHRLINFLKRLEEIKTGIVWIHGGAVADQNRKGILFIACQDVGKTTLVLFLAKHNYYILGDDTIKIFKDGWVFRVQEKAGVFPHPKNLKNLPLTLKERLVGWFKYRFVRIPALYRFIYPNLWVRYEKMGKPLDQAKIQKIFILEKGKLGIYQVNQKEGLRKILASSLDVFLPGGFPKRFFYIYCFHNNFSPTFFEDKYKEILSSALEGKEFFILRGRGPFDFYKLFLEHEGK